LLHVPSGTYLKLDPTADRIVNLLGEHGDVQEVALTLATRFSISVEQAEADVTAVVETLRNLRASRSSDARRPPIRGVLNAFREWRALPLLLQAAVIKVVITVVVLETALRLLDLRRLAALMRVPLAPGASDLPNDRDDDTSIMSPSERRSYWATGWVLDRWIFPGTCLRRALIAGYFLRHHQPVLRLGLIGDGSTTHAWIEAKGIAFNSAPVTGMFAVPNFDAAT
jgi:hypothetical protein